MFHFSNVNVKCNLSHELILCMKITKGRVDFWRRFCWEKPYWHKVSNLQPSVPFFLHCTAEPSSQDWPFSSSLRLFLHAKIILHNWLNLLSAESSLFRPIFRSRVRLLPRNLCPIVFYESLFCARFFAKKKMATVAILKVARVRFMRKRLWFVYVATRGWNVG